VRYGRDVHGNNYLPGTIVQRVPLKPLSSPLTICDRRAAAGFVGLNNLKHTDYVNVVLHALAHVGPIRDFFLQARPI
jgi:hypothetical protein